jgi:uncharacterized protein YjbI with pentapeptide repeats
MGAEIEYVDLRAEDRERLVKITEGISTDLTSLSLHGGGGLFPQIDLTGVDLSNSSLTHLRFEDMCFRGAVLSGVDLDCSKFVNCDFTDAVIITKSLRRGVDFVRCNLSNCTLQLSVWNGWCDFEGSVLKDAIFVNSDITVAYFSNTDCENTDFTGIKYVLQRAEDECFNDYNPDPRMIFNGSSLKGAKFDGLALNHAQFEKADLTGASFKNCDLSSERPIDMEGWSCTEFEYSQATSFEGANLKDSDFEGADLRGVLGL